jgi:purine-binding chemotaxis protein CheW
MGDTPKDAAAGRSADRSVPAVSDPAAAVAAEALAAEQASAAEAAEKSAGVAAADTLRARARALARRPSRAADEAQLELITFMLSGEVLALPLATVREVFRPYELAVLPGAEPPAYAITPWRGVLLTVLDVRAALGTGAAGITDLSHVIVVGLERSSVGILIDRVRGIETVPESSLLTPARQQQDVRLLRAVTRDAVLVLDAAALLDNYG